jgi:hypothetical protein
MSAFENDLFGEPLAPETVAPLKRGEVMSEIAPGMYATHLEIWELPNYVLSKYVPNGDDTYRLEPVDEWAGYLPIGDLKKKLGITGISEMTIRRLCIAELIEYCQPTPQIHLIKIDSLVRHLKRTTNTHSRETPFWDPQRRQLWKTTCGL